MNSLILSRDTDKKVNHFLQKPSQVLILHGLPGTGKRELALTILSKILEVPLENIGAFPYLTEIGISGNSISIDAIRQMQDKLVRVVPGEKKYRRAILIDEAQLLTTEAQNALLKSLEEPPLDTLFILCVDNLGNLVPTVVSRGQSIAVLPVSENDALTKFGNTEEVKKAFLMSAGRAGLMKSLLDSSEHSLQKDLDEAKSLLMKKPYERMLVINDYAKDKQSTNSVLEALKLLARASMINTVKNGKTDQAKRWYSITKRTTSALDAIQRNASVKLVLTDLFSSI